MGDLIELFPNDDDDTVEIEPSTELMEALELERERLLDAIYEAPENAAQRLLARLTEHHTTIEAYLRQIVSPVKYRA